MKKMAYFPLFCLLIMATTCKNGPFELEEKPNIEENWIEIEESQIPSGKVRIINDTTWKVEVTYQKENSLLHKVLIPNGEFVLGDASTIKGISIKAYGQVYGMFAKEAPLDISWLYIKKNQNITIHIKTDWYGQWQFKPEWGSWQTKTEIPAGSNPFDIFPEAAEARQQGSTVEARHILGVPKNATKADINAAYKELSLKWHPDKNPGNKEFAQEVMKILSNARDELLEKAS